MCVKSRRSVGCARNDGKVKTENGVQDESDKGMMYYIMPSCFARWHFSCAIERITMSIAQTASRLWQSPRMSFRGVKRRGNPLTRNENTVAIAIDRICFRNH